MTAVLPPPVIVVPVPAAPPPDGAPAPIPVHGRSLDTGQNRGWLTRSHGAEFAARWMRERCTQYGFCGFGHPRSVRTIRCWDDRCGQVLRTQLCCPTCEANAG